MTFRERKNYTTTDGHRYVSVPTEVPKTWIKEYDDRDRLTYISGEYTIVRTIGPSGSRTYEVYRDGEGLTLSFTGLLRHAKDRAVKNAQGLDVFNWA